MLMKPMLRNSVLGGPGHEKNGTECSSLWNVKFSFSGVTSCTHRETLRLFMEAGWDQQIKLVGGTESNINLCCYISPSPLEIKMLFRKSHSTGRGSWKWEGSSFHRWENRGAGRLPFVKVIQWLWFRAGEAKRGQTLERRTVKGSKRTGQRSQLDAILVTEIFSTSVPLVSRKAGSPVMGSLWFSPESATPEEPNTPSLSTKEPSPDKPNPQGCSPDV